VFRAPPGLRCSDRPPSVLVHEAVRPIEPSLLDAPIVATLAAAVAYYTVNMGTIALMVSLHTRRRLTAVLGDAAWYPLEPSWCGRSARTGAAADHLSSTRCLASMRTAARIDQVVLRK